MSDLDDARTGLLEGRVALRRVKIRLRHRRDVRGRLTAAARCVD